MTTAPRARTHEVLATPNRVDILDRLRKHAEPLDAHTLAEATGLHVTTVRFHLSALIEAGLVVTVPDRPAGRGRPRLRYAPAGPGGDDAEPYRELTDLLAAHFHDASPDRAHRAERVGADWADRRLGNAPIEGDVGTVVRGMFTEMGFDPEPDGDGRLLLHGCPFRTTAAAHPDVVCAAHRGLLRAVVRRLAPRSPVPELHAFERPELCVADLDGHGRPPRT